VPLEVWGRMATTLATASNTMVNNSIHAKNQTVDETQRRIAFTRVIPYVINWYQSGAYTTDHWLTRIATFQCCFRGLQTSHQRVTIIGARSADAIAILAGGPLPPALPIGTMVDVPSAPEQVPTQGGSSSNDPTTTSGPPEQVHQNTAIQEAGPQPEDSSTYPTIEGVLTRTTGGEVIDTREPKDEMYNVSWRSNKAHAKLRHLHKCISCNQFYSHQHKGGDKPHGQCMQQCPYPGCERGGVGAARTHARPEKGMASAGPAPGLPAPVQLPEPKGPAKSKEPFVPPTPEEGVLPSADVDIPEWKADPEFPAKLEVMLDGKSMSRTAIQIGPAVGTPVHYANSLGSLGAAVAGRIVGKQKRFDPPEALRRKVTRMVDRIIDVVLTPEKIKAWRDKAENQPFAELCSKKWTNQMFQNAWDTLIARGSDANVGWEAIIKSEVLQFDVSKGARPRIIMSCGPEAQVMSKVVVRCLEDLYFHHFTGAHIKYKPKVDAVNEILKKITPESRVFQGDGSAWDATIMPELKQLIENRLLGHVAEELFRNGDCCGALKTWWDADLKDRNRNTMTLKFCAGKAVARLVILSTRRSGDSFTSGGNGSTNKILWTCIILEFPEQYVDNPRRGFYIGSCWRLSGVRGLERPEVIKWITEINDKLWEKLKTGKKGPRTSIVEPFKFPMVLPTFMQGADLISNVKYIPAVEGDDSLINTTTRQTIEHIEKCWHQLAFNMKLFERKPGQMIVFVGMEALRQTDGSVSEPLPELTRGLVQSGWTLSADASSETIAGMFAARVEMNRSCNIMGRYYSAVARHWAAQCGDEVVLTRDAQFKLFGQLIDNPRVRFSDYLDKDIADTPCAVTRHYMSDEEIKRVSLQLDALEAIDPAYNLRELFPASVLPKGGI